MKKKTVKAWMTIDRETGYMLGMPVLNKDDLFPYGGNSRYQNVPCTIIYEV